MSDVQAMPTAPDLHHQLFTDSPAATSPPPPLQIKYVELYTDKTSFAACSATVTTDPVSFSFSILSLLGLWFCHFGHGPLKDSVCYCAAKMVIVFVKNSVSARGVLLCKSVDSPYLLTTTSPCVSITFHRLKHRRFFTIGSIALSPLPTSLELLCKSVDSPDLLATTSPLRLHHITPF
ncbi:hypothetical protein Bca4012_051032 [Brassica carinata]